MVKRYIAVILVMLLAVFMHGCEKKQTHVRVDAKGPGFDTLFQLEEACSVIVEAVRLEEAESVITRADGRVVSMYTYSQVQITKIHKDPQNKLQEGDIITILENEAYDETENRVYHVGGYNMMVPGCAYLLFLTDRTLQSPANPYYVATGVNYGTVSLEEDGRNVSAVARDGSKVSDFEKYEGIWLAAKEKYAD